MKEIPVIRLEVTTMVTMASAHNPKAAPARTGSMRTIWIREPRTMTRLPRAWIGPCWKTSPSFSESIEQRATRSEVGWSTSFSAGTRSETVAEESRNCRTRLLLAYATTKLTTAVSSEAAMATPTSIPPIITTRSSCMVFSAPTSRPVRAG